MWGMARVGSSMSVWNYISVGSSLSVRGFTRIGDYLSVHGTVKVGGDKAEFSSDTYIYDSGGSGLQVYVSNSKSLTFTSTGGTLHGMWTADEQISTSDRRLKQDIVPLQRSLRSAIESKMVTSKPTLAAGGATAAASGDSALWMLRQLRPVSYTFKEGADSKHMRFGFIADELERVVPQVVRSVDRKEGEVANMKGVVYQDLIALLTAASQAQNVRMDGFRQRFDQLTAELEKMKQEEVQDRLLMKKVRRKLHKQRLRRRDPFEE